MERYKIAMVINGEKQNFILIYLTSQTKINFCPSIKGQIRSELHKKRWHAGVCLRYEKKLQFKTEQEMMRQ